MINLNTPPTSQTMHANTGFLIDMDGVIYRDERLIPGAADLIHHLIETNYSFVFLTNNSAPTADDLVVKLGYLGIPGLSARHFYTSAMNTADFLSQTHPNCTVYALGDAGLNAALQQAKIHNDALHPDYVVVGEGSPSAERLTKAHELIEKGARLVVTNPDNWCPVTGNKTRPGAGSYAAMLEATTGQRAYYLGKPNPYMLLQARRRLRHNLDQVMMVGDTMETDIRGAVELGLQACLVLTGSTKLENLCNYVYQPTCVMDSVAELLLELKGDGEASTRLNSPTFKQRNSPSTNGRHQIDHSMQHRPRPAMTR